MTLAYCGTNPAAYFTALAQREADLTATIRKQVAHALADLPTFDVVLGLDDLPPLGKRPVKVRGRIDRKRQKQSHRA